eukprot:1601064-Amphidinium_carterae.1
MNGRTTSLLQALHAAKVAIVDEVKELQMRKEHRQRTRLATPRPIGHQGWTDGRNTRFRQGKPSGQ